MTDLKAGTVAEDPLPEVAPKRREKLAENLSVLRSATISIVAILGVLAVLIVTIRDLSRAPVVLEEIGVTEVMTKDGYTGLVLSNMLWDEIEGIRKSTGTGKKNVRIQTAASQLDVVEPGSGLSLQRVTQVLRSVFNFPQTRISGEFTCPVSACAPSELSLTLRIFSGEGTNVIPVGPIGKQPMQDYIHHTAVQLMQDEIDPLVAAWYYYNTRPQNWVDMARGIAMGLRWQEGPKSEEALTLLGAIALEFGTVDEAMAFGAEAVRIGDEIRASRAPWQRILAVFRDDGFDIVRADSLSLQAETLLRTEQYGEAMDLLEQALSHAPNNALIMSNYAFSLFQNGQVDQALDYMREAVMQDADNPYMWLDWGDAYDWSGHPDEAMKKREIAASLGWDDLWVQYYAGFLHIDNALYEARLWAERAPDRPEPWAFWSDMLVEKKLIDPNGFCDDSNGPMSEFLSVAYDRGQPYALENANDLAGEHCGWAP